MLGSQRVTLAEICWRTLYEKQNINKNCQLHRRGKCSALHVLLYTSKLYSSPAESWDPLVRGRQHDLVNAALAVDVVRQGPQPLRVPGAEGSPQASQKYENKMSVNIILKIKKIIKIVINKMKNKMIKWKKKPFFDKEIMRQRRNIKKRRKKGEKRSAFPLTEEEAPGLGWPWSNRTSTPSTFWKSGLLEDGGRRPGIGNEYVRNKCRIKQLKGYLYIRKTYIYTSEG